MSLVNDALRRATEAHKKLSPETVTDAGLQLRPIDPPHGTRKGIGLVLPATVLTILVAAILSLFLATEKIHTASARSAVIASPVVTPGVAPSPPVPVASVQPATVTNSPAPVIEAAPPKLAPLKLQAVFYTPSKPSAIISGKTVFVGDMIQELKVVAIGSASALLVSPTRTNLLTME